MSITAFLVPSSENHKERELIPIPPQGAQRASVTHLGLSKRRAARVSLSADSMPGSQISRAHFLKTRKLRYNRENSNQPSFFLN